LGQHQIIDGAPLKPVDRNYLSAYHSSGSLLMRIHWVNSPAYSDGHKIEKIDQTFILSHVEEPKKSILVDTKNIKIKDEVLRFSDWSFSSDLEKIVLVTNIVTGWRHSFYADYYLHDVNTKETRLLPFKKASKDIPNQIGSGLVALVLWSPIGHNIAWVRDNDLYVTSNDAEFQLTFDGSKNIINGISDWVYEEEVLASRTATWWSLDGTALAFVKFDDTNVLGITNSNHRIQASIFC
jgi:hypothetical protein